MTTWILVAHRAGARLFENKGPGKGLSLVENIDHPEGRLKDHDINADRPGRAFDNLGAGRHGMGKEVSPTQHVSQQFAKSLA